MIAIDERVVPRAARGGARSSPSAPSTTPVAQQPHILDTLAEVHFQLGHRAEAVAAIDEAIPRDPGEDYYREQRRRFLGERDPEDRPGVRSAAGAAAEGALPRKPGLSV